MVGRNLLGWVTLNGPRSLTTVMPREPQRQCRVASGRYQWDWGISPADDFPVYPWRAYIPVQNTHIRSGNQAWVFGKLSADQIGGQCGSLSPAWCLHAELQMDIKLTFGVLCVLCISLKDMYGSTPPSHEDLALDQLDMQFIDVSTMLNKVWDVRRAALELYGWMLYQLHRDPHGWRVRSWTDLHPGCDLPELVHLMHFLDAQKRGCVIDPRSFGSNDLATLVRDGVPVHYQWPIRGTFPLGG